MRAHDGGAGEGDRIRVSAVDEGEQDAMGVAGVPVAGLVTGPAPRFGALRVVQFRTHPVEVQCQRFHERFINENVREFRQADHFTEFCGGDTVSGGGFRDGLGVLGGAGFRGKGVADGADHGRGAFVGCFGRHGDALFGGPVAEVQELVGEGVQEFLCGRWGLGFGGGNGFVERSGDGGVWFEVDPAAFGEGASASSSLRWRRRMRCR
jgi:hypothetical protein